MNLDTHVMHGYDMRAIDKFARKAVEDNREKFGAGGSVPALIEAAWSAIAERLCASPTRPSPSELIAAGFEGARTEFGAQQHGLTGTYYKHGAGWVPTAVFSRHWQEVSDFGKPEGCVEPTAVREVWATLSEYDRQTLKVRAVTNGDKRYAAELLECSKSKFDERLREARDNFQAAWFDFEAPSTRNPRRGHKCTQRQRMGTARRGSAA